MGLFNKLSKWSDSLDNRDVTELQQAADQHRTNANLQQEGNEYRSLQLLRNEDTAMNKQDDLTNEQRKN